MKIFENHVLKIIDDRTLLFKQPNSGFDSLKFTLIDNSLVVTGDLGDAIYQFGNNPPLSWNFLSGLSLSYFAAKCRASSVGTPFRRWSSKKAAALFEKRFDEYWAETDRDTDWWYKNSDKLDDVKEACFSFEELQIYLQCSDFWSVEDRDCGWELHINCQQQFEGLQLALAQKHNTYDKLFNDWMSL